MTYEKKRPGQYYRGPRIPKLRSQISVRLGVELVDYLEREAYMHSSRPPYIQVTMSDVIRLAIEHYRAHQALGMPTPKDPCMVTERLGHKFCATCGLTWVANDPNAPTCQLKKLRKND